jgi:hypothetical protein
MMFWAGIFVGGLFTWLAVKMGFYETWALLFNLVISIYVAIFLAPVILDLVPSAGETSYANALALAVTAGGTFLVLQGITYVFFTGQFKVSLPKVFDLLFAGVLGFLTGFLLFSFIGLIVAATPISRNSFASATGFNRRSQQANISYIAWWCDLVSFVVSSPDRKVASEEAIDQLLIPHEPKTQNAASEQTDPNEPAAPSDVTDDRTRSQPSP